MYAIIEISGRQEKVEKDSVIEVNRLPNKTGSAVKIPHVLLAKKNEEYHIGTPYVKGAHVECEVISHPRGRKVIAFKYKRRKSYHRKVGHRQDLTVLKVTEIHI